MVRSLLSLLVAAALVGCRPSGESAQTQEGASTDAGQEGNAKPKKKFRIAVIPKGTTHEFWKSVHYGAAKAADEFDAEIIWLGPLLEQDREGQITVVQNLITQRVDGICLAPIDSRALVAPVKEAHAEHIPVVIFDSGLEDERHTVSYVATDNFRGGQLAAEEMARRLPDGGKVILLRYMPGSDSTRQREEGFLGKLRDFKRLKVLSSDQYSGDTPQSSLDKAEQLLNKFGEEVDGIFAVCEPNAAGTLQALQNAGLAGKVVFIGFDPNKRMVQALADGEMQGIVLQDPVQMGYLSVKTMLQHLEHMKVELRINTGEFMATPENMREESIHKLLAPPQFAD